PVLGRRSGGFSKCPCHVRAHRQWCWSIQRTTRPETSCCGSSSLAHHHQRRRRRGMMRRTPALLWLGLAGLGVSAIPAPRRSDVVLTQISPKLSISGSLRLRGELWNWFEPTGPQSNEYQFFASVLRGAVKWTDEYFDLMLEAQQVGLMNLPDN